jgi:hypothetical protein
MKPPLFFIGAAALLTVAIPRAARAESSPASSLSRAVATASPKLVDLRANDLSMTDVAKDLASQAQATIWVEPGLSQKVNARLVQIPLEDALNRITGDQGPLWARLEIVQKKGASPPQDALFDMVRALNLLSSDRMTAQLSGGRGSVTLAKSGPAVSSPILASDEALMTVYVIASRVRAAPEPSKEGSGTSLPAGEGVSRFGQLSQQRMDLMQSMSPGERRQAVQQEITSMLQLSPQARLQMMLDRRDAYRSLPDDIRTQLRQARRETWQQLGGGPRGWRNRQRNANPAPTPPG